MKVLMLGWELPPHNSGGLGVACYQLCEALAKTEVDLEFILPYRTNHRLSFMRVTGASELSPGEVLLGGSAYESYRYFQKDESLASYDIHDLVWRYELEATKLASIRDFDIVHAHDWLTFRAALRIKQLKGCPIVLHVHSTESDRAGGKHGNPLVHEIEELAMLEADSIIAVSEHTKRNIIRDYAIPADKIEVVHNSIDARYFEPLEEDNAYKYIAQLKNSGYNVVANVGRLTIQKGLTNFLHAARMVVEKLPKTVFLVVGNGEQLEELIMLAADLEIATNVIFAGFQRGKFWRDTYGIADLFVMPSISEPFGLTPLEAGFYGLPSLISKQAGVSEVLHNCLKVDFWDVRQMADKIIGVLSSPSLKEVLKENLQRELAGISWEKSAVKVKNLYTRNLESVAR